VVLLEGLRGQKQRRGWLGLGRNLGSIACGVVVVVVV
jgi:hypothetical protein